VVAKDEWVAPLVEGMEGNGRVELDKLTVEQLGKVKEALEGDLEQLNGHFQSLQVAASRFHTAGIAVHALAEQNQGDAMLIPLTSSLYVPGKLGDTKSVLIDIGTGYYVEKTPEDGTDYCKRKVKLLKENIEKLAHIISQKREQLMHVNGLISMRSETAKAPSQS